MNKLIGLALVCSVLLACSGSVTIMSEEENLGTTATSSGTTPTQPPDGDGGSGDAGGGGNVVGGAGGEGGSVSDGGTSEGGSPPDDCVEIEEPSKPVVTLLPISSLLANQAQLGLIKFQIASENGTPVAVKQVSLYFEYSNEVGMGLFSLYRDETEISPYDYFFVWALEKPLLVIQFVNEEIVSSGNVYTLRADVNGAKTGQFITTGLPNVNVPDWESKKKVSGGLAYTYEPGLYGEFLILGVEDAQGVHDASFIWSDLTACPHSPNTSPNPSEEKWSSKDWFNEVGINDLQSSWTLTL